MPSGARSREARPSSTSRPEPGARSRITLVALLEPWIAAVVVAVALPEPLHVVVEQLDPGDPLGRLPEVQVRHQHAHGAAVLGRERLAVELPHDPRLAVEDVVE